MAYITQHINVDVDIEVDEFVDSCDSREIKELINYLQEQGHLNESILSKGVSVLEQEWNSVLNKLSKSRLLLSIEEEEIIKKIANKF